MHCSSQGNSHRSLRLLIQRPERTTSTVAQALLLLLLLLLPAMLLPVVVVALVPITLIFKRPHSRHPDPARARPACRNNPFLLDTHAS